MSAIVINMPPNLPEDTKSPINYCIPFHGDGVTFVISEAGKVHSDHHHAFEPKLPHGHVEPGTYGPYKPVEDNVDVTLTYHDDDHDQNWDYLLQIRPSCP
jgi:hypothetical protein